MSVHMVIAPGEPVDRRWFKRGPSIVWMPRLSPASVFELSEPIGPKPVQPLRATLQTLDHPAWLVRLRFWVDNRLGTVHPTIPDGYVMPGAIQGLPLERSCRRCQEETHFEHRHCWED